jgi:predicted phage baseplate assembly protein
MVAAEPDREGRATVRFGDGEHGRRPPVDDPMSVRYRVGHGRVGNVGRESLVHLVEPAVFPPSWPAILEVRNPLAASGGIDPEPVERVRRLAPDAFRAVLARAVTEEDYAAAAEQLPAVSRSVATYRWTGSWLTVFVSVDPRGTDTLTPDLAHEVRIHLERFRQAGYDLEIRPPRFVALDVGVRVCASRGHRPADVTAALLDALSNRDLVDRGQGFFHPDRFTFGQPLHLSQLYAAIEEVPGVDAAEVVRFRRFGDTADAIDVGRIEADRLEILRLANDPSLPEHGVLAVEVVEGVAP